jgi:hypothetical protein
MIDWMCGSHGNNSSDIQSRLWFYVDSPFMPQCGHMICELKNNCVMSSFCSLLQFM